MAQPRCPLKISLHIDEISRIRPLESPKNLFLLSVEKQIPRRFAPYSLALPPSLTLLRAGLRASLGDDETLLEQIGLILLVDRRMLGLVPRALQLLDQRHKTRSEHHEIASPDGFVGVRDASRNENSFAGTDVDLTIRKAKAQHSLEDVPRLVVRVVDVQLRRATPAPLANGKRLP